MRTSGTTSNERHAFDEPVAWSRRTRTSLALALVILVAVVAVAGSPRALATPVTTPDGLLLETFHLENADLEVIASQVRPMLSPRGMVVVDARSMSLVVKDIPENIGKVRQFLQRTAGSSTMIKLYMALVERVDPNTPNIFPSVGQVPTGGEGLLPITSRVSPAVLKFFNAYALERMMISTGVVFKEVQIGLGVVPQLVEGGEVELTAYPRIAYTTAQGNGVIRVMECATRARVASGKTVTMTLSHRDDYGVLPQVIAAGAFKDQEKISFIVAPTIMKEEQPRPQPPHK